MALLLERGTFRGKALLGMLVDLPFAISPVVVGLALVLVYGKTGWFGSWLIGTRHPGDLLGARDGDRDRRRVAAVRRARDDAGAARARHRRRAGRRDARRERRGRRSGGSRCPAIRWGVVYGVVLTTARALGEFGAVSIVSGRIEGQTQTLPLYVQDRFENFDSPAPTRPRWCSRCWRWRRWSR